MAISLPILPKHAQQELRLLSSAVVNKGTFNGSEQRIARLGDRYSYQVSTRPLSYTQAMTVVAKLVQGTTQKLLCPIQQGDLAIGSPGSPVVVSGSGTTLNIQGLSASYSIRAGQMFSIVHAGKRYLHMVTDAVTATAGGIATVAIWPMLRMTLTTGDVCEFATPQIEGFLTGLEQGWNTDLAQAIGLTFTVSEAL
jgi:hypothetical protein